MGPIGCHRISAGAACILATVTAILLWGVGAESVHFRDYLPGCLLLADAAIVTLLESLTVWQYMEWRRSRFQSQSAEVTASASCRLPPRLLTALDTYRRAALYFALSVPCFVHLKRLWLPAIPGGMLLLSACLYLMKHCCALRRQRAIVKVATFVRFKDESVSEAACESQGTDSQWTVNKLLSHQSSFASSHSSGSTAQMGSKDSGIEASQRDVPACAVAPAAAAASSAAAAADARSSLKPQGGLVRASSSSPDRCCLINEDCLSLRD